MVRSLSAQAKVGEAQANNVKANQDLERYKAFYKQAYGADVSETDLLREMARRFMDGDREFQVAKYGLKARSRAPRQPAAPTLAAKEQS